MNKKKGKLGVYGVLIILFSTTVYALSLPTVGGDSGTWGTILNEYLSKVLGDNATTLNISGDAIFGSNVSIDGNLSLGQKITFALGEIIDNIVDGWIRITGNLNVTNDVEIGGNLNVTGNVNVGSTSLTVNGTEVCLSDGTNCQAGVSYYFNKTSTTSVGSFSGGGYAGYKAGNDLCNQEFSGTHLCYQSELILTINAKNVSALSQWDSNAWIITGGAKYSPATLPVNDCNGFTHGTSDTYLGSFWMFNQTNGGTGGVGHCANNLSIACCKSW